MSVSRKGQRSPADNFAGGLEATAYYTSDLDNAVGTGIDMVARATTAHFAAETRRQQMEIHFLRENAARNSREIRKRPPVGRKLSPSNGTI